MTTTAVSETETSTPNVSNTEQIENIHLEESMIQPRSKNILGLINSQTKGKKRSQEKFMWIIVERSVKSAPNASTIIFNVPINYFPRDILLIRLYQAESSFSINSSPPCSPWFRFRRERPSLVAIVRTRFVSSNSVHLSFCFIFFVFASLERSSPVIGVDKTIRRWKMAGAERLDAAPANFSLPH